MTRWVTEAMLVSSVERRDTGPANAPPAAAVAADFVEEEGEGAVVAVRIEVYTHCYSISRLYLNEKARFS